jgi:predicted nuclease of predicted toxin-antitoxin system
VRFLIDQNLSPLLAQALGEAGHDAVHVRDIGLASADDAAVLAAAREDARILISADTDFGGLLADAGASLPSVILIRRLQGRRAAEQAELLLAHVHDVQDDLVRGCIVALDEDRIRIRGLPI